MAGDPYGKLTIGGGPPWSGASGSYTSTGTVDIEDTIRRNQEVETQLEAIRQVVKSESAPEAKLDAIKALLTLFPKE